MYAKVLDAFLKEDWDRYEPLKTEYQALVDTLEPTYIGPTWKRGEDGKFALPEKSLGYEIIEWCYRWLKDPQGNGPFRFTNEQARFILWFYALDNNGQFKYRSGVLQRLKGWG